MPRRSSGGGGMYARANSHGIDMSRAGGAASSFERRGVPHAITTKLTPNSSFQGFMLGTLPRRPASVHLSVTAPARKSTMTGFTPGLASARSPEVDAVVEQL